MPMTEEQIDALRLQAFQTNSETDRAVYFDAVNQWFQERHYRQIDDRKNVEIERLRADNARLREALKGIMQWENRMTLQLPPEALPALAAARAALAEMEQKL